MFLIFRIIVITLAGLLTAVVAGFFVLPYYATAPSEKPSIIVEHTEPQVEPAEATPPKPTETTDTTSAPAQGGNDEQKIKEALEIITKTLAEPVAYTPSSLNFNSLNDTAREATVNILCSSKSGGVLNSISGSGVFIDPTGVILTNSHVAQYFLLKNYPSPGFLNCIVRTGSPAYPTYTAELLFLPPSWINANAKKIIDDTPTGNGEHDYALLRVTGTINPDAELPSAFPYLPLLFKEVTKGEPVLLAGYPAGFLGGILIAKDLYAVSSVATIGEVYTYDATTVDIFSVGGSVVAQQGSSGGAVVGQNGNLVGLIVTSTITPDTSSRDLHAVATSYIARDFEHERGISLATFLSQNLEEAAQSFAVTTAPTLAQALITVLSQ